uniref:Lipoprotein n=1 Tax=Haemonchus contortus TaxID=6289 RepID=A0A7I4YHM7_HAECO
MKRLLLSFVFIGTVLACSPVPEPKVKGKGHDIVYVTLVTNQTYNPAGISTFLSDFSKTEIQQYSASVGNFSDLNCTNTDGYFTWTFRLTDANCSIVEMWIKQIVASSSFYKNGFSTCGSETAYVTLVTKYPYNLSEVSEVSSNLLQKIQRTQRFLPHVGNITNPHATNVNGYIAYTFTFPDTNCTKVKRWMTVVRLNALVYDLVNGNFTCIHTGTPTSANANLIEITTTPPPTTTTTPLVIVPGGALPVAPAVIPYQQAYEESAERLEEFSSFESMSIMRR